LGCKTSVRVSGLTYGVLLVNGQLASLRPCQTLKTPLVSSGEDGAFRAQNRSTLVNLRRDSLSKLRVPRPNRSKKKMWNLKKTTYGSSHSERLERAWK
jgi:hypothetical protein